MIKVIMNLNKLLTYNYVGGFFMLKDSLFKKIENKTNINKETILSIADKLQKSNMKDEKVLNELVNDLYNLTGREVDEIKKKKIIDTILKDNIPKNLDNMI
jgi:hypothetical protein